MKLKITEVEKRVAQLEKKLDTICQLSVCLEQCLKISLSPIEEVFKDCYLEDSTGMLFSLTKAENYNRRTPTTTPYVKYDIDKYIYIPHPHKLFDMFQA